MTDDKFSRRICGIATNGAGCGKHVYYRCPPNLSGCVSGTTPVGPTGPTGPTGPSGLNASTIPFCIGKYGTSLFTDDQGEPLGVNFSGFGFGVGTSTYLQEGEWATGHFEIRQEMPAGICFVMPHNAALTKIHVLVSTAQETQFDAGATVRPFVCVATSDAQNYRFTILQDTVTYTEPYEGDVLYPQHTIRRGALTNLDIKIAEGTLVGIVAGIRAENVTFQQHGMLVINGGLFLG